MKRRGFVKMCAAAVAGVTAAPELLGNNLRQYHPYGRVALIDPELQQPVKADALEIGETYIFHYPFVSTPCFLIDLGSPVQSKRNLKTHDGKSYRWLGGAGPRRSVVAFSAICAHKMTHPAPSVSFINYRHNPVRFRNSEDKIEQRGGVIYCCSERSVYDPAQGGRVLGGPAPQPLAAIELEYDDRDDAFYAKATIGGEMFDKFFKNFRDRLVLQYGTLNVDANLNGGTDLLRLSDYTDNTVSCQA